MRGQARGLGRAAVAAGPLSAQCAMCQSVVAQSPEAQAAARQLNLAILVLFSAPYLVVAGLAFLMFRKPIGALVKSRVERFRARAFLRLRPLPR